MKKYLLVLVILLAGCEIKPLLAPIESASIVADNSLSNAIRVSRVVRADGKVYLAGVGLWQRSDDFSWSKVGSLPMDDPSNEPVQDLIGVANGDLWLASSKAVYQLSGGSWTYRGSRRGKFGATFLTANGEVVLSDQDGNAFVFNSGAWDPIPTVTGRPVALVYQGSSYVLATSTALRSGSVLQTSMTKQTAITGLPDTLSISDLVVDGSTYYLAANGTIYKGTSLSNWTHLGGSSVQKIIKVEDFLLATLSSEGFGVLNVTSGKWAAGGPGDGFSDSASFAVQAGDQSLDKRKLARFFYDKPASGEARVYALAEGAHGMYAAHLSDGRWSWERE